MNVCYVEISGCGWNGIFKVLVECCGLWVGISVLEVDFIFCYINGILMGEI